MENASKALIIAGAVLIAILLISMGVMLVNSGKGVTDTATKGMASEKIQIFNSQFTPYEGNKSGTEVKSLINKVIASNAVDEEHFVSVFGTGSVKSVSNIKSTAKYTVKIHYTTIKGRVKRGGNPGSGYYSLGTGDAAGKWTENGYIDWIEVNPS